MAAITAKYVGPYSPAYYKQISTPGGYSTGPTSYSVNGQNTSYQKIVPSPTNSVPSGGGGGGGGQVLGAATQQPQQQGAPQIPTPDQPNIDFDALIAPAIQNLNDAIGQAGTDYNTNVGSINANSANQATSLNNSIADQQNTLGQSRTSQQNLSQNAADQARQQYSEIQQGLQSRYGGTTGTGAFATELAGRQTLQNVGAINQNLTQAMKSIDDKVVQVKAVGQQALQDLNQKTQDQLSQAKSQLDNLVLNLRGQQGMLQAQKAQMTAQAIQNYQNSVNSVQQANAQFAQQIYAQQLAAEQNLTAAKAQASGYANSFVAGTPNIGNQVTPVGNQVSQVGGTTPAAGPASTFNTLNKNLLLG